VTPVPLSNPKRTDDDRACSGRHALADRHRVGPDRNIWFTKGGIVGQARGQPDRKSGGYSVFLNAEIAGIAGNKRAGTKRFAMTGPRYARHGSRDTAIASIADEKRIQCCPRSESSASWPLESIEQQAGE
jgi:hypothetical protein